MQIDVFLPEILLHILRDRAPSGNGKVNGAGKEEVRDIENRDYPAVKIATGTIQG